MTGFKLEAIELVGVVVNELDAAVARYGELFGLDFLVFTPGSTMRSCCLDHFGRSRSIASQKWSDALDTSGLFELIEIPGVAEGFRNIHFRVTRAWMLLLESCCWRAWSHCCQEPADRAQLRSRF